MNKPDEKTESNKITNKFKKKRVFYYLIPIALVIAIVTPVTVVEVNKQKQGNLNIASTSPSTVSSAVNPIPSATPSQVCNNNASAFICQNKTNCGILYNCNHLPPNTCTLVFQSHPWINLTNLNQKSYFGYTLRMYNNTICNDTYFDYNTSNLVCPQIGNNSTLSSYQSYILLC